METIRIFMNEKLFLGMIGHHCQPYGRAYDDINYF